MSKFLKLIRNEEGATAIEYGLIAALIAVAAIGAMQGIGNSLNNTFNNVSNHLGYAWLSFGFRGGGAERRRRSSFVCRKPSDAENCCGRKLTAPRVSFRHGDGDPIRRAGGGSTAAAPGCGRGSE